jgi:hypothetical protein
MPLMGQALILPLDRLALSAKAALKTLDLALSRLRLALTLIGPSPLQKNFMINFSAQSRLVSITFIKKSRTPRPEFRIDTISF